MKTIGLLGGMSWESTIPYYRIINETVKEKLGGLHSAKCVLYSVDFDGIERCQSSGDWERAAEILSGAAKRLEQAGADFIVICTNTMHKVAPEVERAVSVPLLHIAGVTARALKEKNVAAVGLLGTKYTMEQDFYKDVLREAGIEVLIPGKEERELVNRVIFEELCVGILSEESKRKFLGVINSFNDRGAGGVILGCTEIGLLVSQKDTEVPLYDTTVLHARAAALESLGG